MIGATNGFEKWLGCDVQLAKERPVPLTEGVMDRSGTWQHRNAAGKTEATELIPTRDIRQRKKKASSQDQIVPLVRKLVQDGEKVLVFRNRRGPAAGCAEYLAEELGLPPAQAVIDALPQLDNTASSARLRRALTGGTAFHTTDLKREERSLVEAAFRDPDGPCACAGGNHYGSRGCEYAGIDGHRCGDRIPRTGWTGAIHRWDL